jgi:hypothetical protein
MVSEGGAAADEEIRLTDSIEDLLTSLSNAGRSAQLVLSRPHPKMWFRQARPRIVVVKVAFPEESRDQTCRSYQVSEIAYSAEVRAPTPKKADSGR